MQNRRSKTDAKIQDCLVCALKYAEIVGWFGGTLFSVGSCPHSHPKSANARFVSKKILFFFPIVLYSPTILHIKYLVDLFRRTENKMDILHLTSDIILLLLSYSSIINGMLKYKLFSKYLNKCSEIMEKKIHYGLGTVLNAKDMRYLKVGRIVFLLLFLLVDLYYIFHFTFLEQNEIEVTIVKITTHVLLLLSFITFAIQGLGLFVVYMSFYEKCFGKIKIILIAKLQERPRKRVEGQLSRLNCLYQDVTKNFIHMNDTLNPLFTFLWILALMILVSGLYQMVVVHEYFANYLNVLRNVGFVVAVLIFSVKAQELLDLVSLRFAVAFFDTIKTRYYKINI